MIAYIGAAQHGPHPTTSPSSRAPRIQRVIIDCAVTGPLGRVKTSLYGRSMSWVDVTTAVGTAGAAVVALGLGLRAEYRAIRAERQAKVENERRQAIHVAAWMLVEQDDGEGPHEIDANNPSFNRSKVRVYEVILNASEEPVWDIIVNAPILLEKHSEGTALEWAEAEDEILSIGPHQMHKSEITVSTVPYNRLPLRVQFRDNAGRNWTLDERGRLHHGRTSKPMLAEFDEAVYNRTAEQLRMINENT